LKRPKSGVNKAIAAEERAIFAEAPALSDKTLLLQSSLTPESVAPWLAVLQTAPPLPPALAVDYGPYMAGSAELAWFDEQLTFAPPIGQERATLVALIAAILAGLRQAARPIAHLKFFIQDAETGVKLSFTAPDALDWEQLSPSNSARR
jgi:hypothetical protein